VRGVVLWMPSCLKFPRGAFIIWITFHIENICSNKDGWSFGWNLHLPTLRWGKTSPRWWFERRMQLLFMLHLLVGYYYLWRRQCLGCLLFSNCRRYCVGSNMNCVIFFVFFITSLLMVGLLPLREMVVYYVASLILDRGICKDHKLSLTKIVASSWGLKAMGVGLPIIGWNPPFSSSSQPTSTINQPMG